ncbi:MAG TPA: DUF2207 domain-containing protein [Candidatus Diapherotrites archaeon]|nr:DUF2207 domain-containing protein [Candidatus Diapherotrites archaeon]
MASDSKIENQTFYTEPPFSYRPSVAEFLATMHVTKKGIIADLMHLDRKGKLNIERYFLDGLEIRLKDSSDLNDNEVFLWELLQAKARGGLVSIKFSELDYVSGKYESLVLQNTVGKFGSAFPFNPAKIPGGFVIFGFISYTILSIIAFFFITIPLLALFPIMMLVPSNEIRTALQLMLAAVALLAPFIVVYFISSRKIGDSRIERKFLLKEIVWQIIKIHLLMYLTYGLMAVIVLSTLIVPTLISSQSSLVLGTWILTLTWLAAWVVYSHFFGKIAYRFFYWLFENKETAENRKKWLAFKDFIFDYSQLDEKPLKYYELWGEFYYYALAVGAVKKPF